MDVWSKSVSEMEQILLKREILCFIYTKELNLRATTSTLFINKVKILETSPQAWLILKIFN